MLRRSAARARSGRAGISGIRRVPLPRRAGQGQPQADAAAAAAEDSVRQAQRVSDPVQQAQDDRQHAEARAQPGQPPRPEPAE